MATLPSVNPNQPIPNGPFSYPETWLILGALGPLITGSGICVNSSTGVISATGGGGGGSGTVTSIATGAGLTGGPITTSGTIALGDSGVISGSYARANVTVDSFGRVTDISSDAAPGTVCLVQTGIGLEGGPIFDSGTICLSNTSVVPGSYDFPTITVNSQGQITTAFSNTAVSSITASGGLLGGTITTSGVISLPPTGVIPGNYTAPDIAIDTYGRVTAATGNNFVSQVDTGTGLTGGPITSTGTVALSSTGVTPGSYTKADLTVNAQGQLTFVSNGSAVTCICTGFGLSGGPIGSTGTVALAALTPSSAGTYTFGSFTTDAYGRVTNAVSNSLCSAFTVVSPLVLTGNSTTVNLSILNATSSVPGVVTLTDNLTTNSSTTSLTAAQGFSLQNQISGLSIGSAAGLIFAGTFDAQNGIMITVTNEGVTGGFSEGGILPQPNTVNGYFVIATTSGLYTPTGGAISYNTTQGDWFLSDGVAWTFLNVGFDAPSATTTTAGIVRLATTPETRTGTSTALAVTPAGVCQTYVSKSCYTNRGILLAGSGNGFVSAIPYPSGDNLPLVTSNVTDTGFDFGLPAVPKTCFTSKGDLLVGQSNACGRRLGVGTNGQVLTANSLCALGVTWSPPSVGIETSCITGKGSILTGSAPNTPVSLAAGTDGYALVACSSCPEGLTWAPSGGGSGSVTSISTGTGLSGGPITTSGTIALSNTTVAPGTYTYACITVDQQGRLTSSNNGVTPLLPACFNAKGDLLAGTANDLFTALTVGSNGQVLTADSTCAPGLKWQVPIAAPGSSTVPGALFGCTTNNLTDPQFATSLGLGSVASLCSVAIGASAGNAIGQRNLQVGIGARAGGSGNTVMGGYGASSCCSTGVYNVIVGSQTGTGGSCNTFLGFNVSSTSYTGNNNTSVGNASRPATVATSNSITLGNSCITVLRAQVTSITALSDARDKTGVTALPVGLDFVNALRPVKFTWQMREANEVKDGLSEAGFIAQDLKQAQDDFGITEFMSLVYDENPDKLEASPSKLIPVLVKAIQELSTENREIKHRIAQLESNG